ncbi:MAG: HEAT repeat domain-containing protein, partial [Leptospiraceae bacterium]|nr:HEAT repeat domain-containing protein [Leptospiraceae bacterium]
MASFWAAFCGPPKPTAVPGATASGRPLQEWAAVEAGLQSTDANQRADAILAAMEFQYRQAGPRLLQLAQEDEAANVRQTAAIALGQFQVKGAGPILTHLLQNDKAVQAEYIMEAAARLEDKRVAPAIVPYLKSDLNNTRLIAMQTLVSLNATSQGPAILKLAQGLSDPDQSRAAVMALGKLKVQRAAPWLRQLAQTTAPGPNRAAVYLALGRIADKASAPLLIEGLALEEPRLRENAGKALILIQDHASLSAIFPLLESDNPEIAYNAAAVLSEISDPKTRQQVLRLLNQGPPQSIGPAALVAGRLKISASRLPIEKRLADKKSPDREQLAQALGWLQEKASLPLLIQVLQEAEGTGRLGAAWS